ncbi:MAG TPA: hypothetical protein VF828_01275 [Patescibacteria group bacterium]
MKKKLTAAGLVIIFLITAGVIYLSLSPAKGTITKPKTGTTVSKTVATYKNYNNDYWLFTYPAEYSLRPLETGDKNTVAAVELLGESGNSARYVINTKSNNDPNLDNQSGVIMRRGKPDVYRENVISIDGIDGLLFSRNDSVELVALVPKNGQIFTISMTANSNDGETYLHEFEKITQSIKLK